MKKEVRFRAAVTLTLILLWFLVSWIAARWLIVSAPLRQADALLILSGSGAYQDRTQYAAQLYHEGLAPVIIITNDGERSGWSNVEQRNPFFYERSQSELLRLGVPASAIKIVPQPVSGTYQEALLLREYAQGSHLSSLLIVTSSHHSRRALWTFSRVFRSTEIKIGLLELPSSLESFGSKSWWFHIRGWREVALEYPKLAYYWLFYS